jgi:5-methylcytosine-specific restriction endonuclease McrA
MTTTWDYPNLRRNAAPDPANPVAVWNKGHGKWAKPCDVCGGATTTPADATATRRGNYGRHHRCAHVVKARLASPYAMLPARDCAVCARRFIPWNRTEVSCSPECKAARKMEARKSDRTCGHCGDTFRTRTRDPRQGGYCSNRCASNAQVGRPPGVFAEERPKAHRVYFPLCRVCGAMFAARNRRMRVCSDNCRMRLICDRGTSLYAAACEVGGKGAEARRVLIGHLRNRDGDRCQICHGLIDFEIKSGSRGSRRGHSIDHITPRSLGGGDDLDNLRLTHWGCNQARGNRIPAQGLLPMTG